MTAITLTKRLVARLLSGALAASAMGGGMHAWAQDTGPLVLPEITITGEKTTRDRQESGASVVTIRPDADGAAGDETLEDLIDRAPNVTPFAGDGGVAIRGIGQTGFGFGDTNFPNTRSPGDLVTTFVDGIPVSVSAGPTSLWDVDQVEIFRGAQSTTFGRGVLGGAVVIESADPTGAFSARARGLGGSQSTFGGSIAAGAAILPGVLSFRASFDRTDTDGFNENVTLGVGEDADRQILGRGKILFTPTDDLEFLLSGLVSDRESGASFVDAGFIDEREIFTNVQDVTENVIGGASLRANWQATDRLKLESSTVFVTEDATRIFDLDTTAVPIGVGVFDDDIRTLSQEFRLRLDTDRIRGFVGVYGERFEGAGLVDAGPFGSTLTDSEVETFAGFGEVEIDVTQSLRLILGGRIERETNETVVSDGVTTLESDGVFLGLLPKAGLTYFITPDVNVFALFQEGFRAGGAGASIVGGIPFSFEPETSRNYDIGVRSEFFSGRARLNANAFLVDWTDQQLEVPSGSGLPGDTIVENVAESRMFGLEIDGELQATPDLRLFTGLGLLYTEFTDVDDSTADLDGNEFSFAPTTTISLGGRYEHPVGFFASVTGNYRSGFFSDAENSAIDEVDGRFIADAAIGFKRDGGRVALSVTNLFDADYLDISSQAVTFFGSNGLVAPGPGRQVLLEGSISF